MPQLDQLELFPDTSKDVPLSQATQAIESAQLPEYRIRESKRAKHVSIKISVEGDVEVVVPFKFDRSQLPDILERRRLWILKTRSRLISAAEDTVEDWQAEKPEKIIFRWQADDASNAATGTESWSVRYQPTAGRQITCVPSLNNQLAVKGNTDSADLCHSVLRKWLSHRAHKSLTPWLRQLGYELDLPCRRISVRGQKTRWASCSNLKDISLNYKLLFLPRPLVHYVLVHELCHTVHMNHSKQFWALVESKMPDYEHWDTALKKGWRYVPRWVEKK